MCPTKARQELEKELNDIEFRKMYGAAEAKSELALTIANARKLLNLTQSEFSQCLGVSQPYIAKIEGGEANPTIGSIGSMLAVLDLRLEIKVAPLLQRQSIDCPKVTSTYKIVAGIERINDANAGFAFYASSYVGSGDIRGMEQHKLDNIENTSPISPKRITADDNTNIVNETVCA